MYGHWRTSRDWEEKSMNWRPRTPSYHSRELGSWIQPFGGGCGRGVKTRANPAMWATRVNTTLSKLIPTKRIQPMGSFLPEHAAKRRDEARRLAPPPASSGREHPRE